MDKKTLTGWVLITVLFIGYMYFTKNDAEELVEQDRIEDSIKTAQRIQDSLAYITSNKTIDTNSIVTQEDTTTIDSSLLAQVDYKRKLERYGKFANFTEQEDEFLEVENEVLRIVFNRNGGKVERVILKEFDDFDGEDVVLIGNDKNKFNYQFTAENRIINTEDLYFTSESESADGTKKLTFRVDISANQYIEQVYTIKPGEYLVDYDFNIVGLDKIIPRTQNYVSLNWLNYPNLHEKNTTNERNLSSIYFKYADEDADHCDCTGDDEEGFDTKVEWVSHSQQFFNATLIAKNQFDEGKAKIALVDEENTETLKKMETDLIIPFDNSPNFQFPMQFYFGPNDHSLLSSYDIGMEEMIPLGWGIFGMVNEYVIIPLFKFFETFIPNYGLIILLLTFLIKMVLYPLTYKTYKSSAKMKAIQPELAELKEKYGEKDATKLQQEQMKLYSKAGVNPLGGCLPQLLQFPILIAMYRFFPSSIELRQQGFLWATDLSTYDTIFNLPFEIPFYGAHVSLFTLLMAISSLAYAKYSAGSMPGGDNPQTKIIQYVMPIFLLFMLNSWSAGLTSYMFFSNVITIGQTLFANKVLIDHDKIRKEIEENKKSPKKKGKFQAKMEQLLKEQQEINAKKKKK